MDYYKNILETIGDTPLVEMHKVTKDVPGLILAKIETTNPGNSVKDRMAVQMVEDAEKDGKIKPGGTIVEGTSGNTGMGLALVCITKGYKLVCVLSDKQSKEKMDILRAVGAEVVVCPTAVAPDDPQSYYSVAKRIAEETPNSIYIDQYNNLSNRKAHYLTTGPEIWEQTEGKITHFVVGVGTGGTISGVGKYLKEKNPDIQIIGVDSYGSAFKKYHETGIFDEKEIYPYITEGIGEDILPENVDFSVIDYFEKVTDKDSAVYQRRLAREEGIFVGNSAGSAAAALVQMKDRFKPDDVIVVLFHDHGSRYVGKFFNDDWMRERGFLDETHKTAGEMISGHKEKSLVTISSEELVSGAIAKLKKYNISQIPVMNGDESVGSIYDARLFDKITDDPKVVDRKIADVMSEPYPIVEHDASIQEVAKMINKANPAVLVRWEDGKNMHILTRHDLIGSFA